MRLLYAADLDFKLVYAQDINIVYKYIEIKVYRNDFVEMCWYTDIVLVLQVFTHFAITKTP